ncbi:hypothetical protein BGX27_009796 [Mortierella sp. AM989]|nr:hypothetical protein BGX27_009796 [Mortierella sp. AM989]
MEPEKWTANCDKIMRDIPMSTSSIIQDVYSELKNKSQQTGYGTEIPQTETGTANSTAKRRTKSQKDFKVFSAPDISSHAFLCLLVRLRKVIIQDAVLFLRDKALSHVLHHPVFKSPEFQQYQADLLDVLKGDTKSLQNFERDIPGLIQVMETSRLDIINNSVALQHTQQQMENILSQKLGQLQEGIQCKQDHIAKELSDLRQAFKNENEARLLQQRNLQLVLMSMNSCPASTSTFSLSSPPTTSQSAGRDASSVSSPFAHSSQGDHDRDLPQELRSLNTMLPMPGFTPTALTDEQPTVEEELPFRFFRDAATVRDVWDEFQRYYACKRKHRRLGYDVARETDYTSEKRFINNRHVIVKEIDYLKATQGIDTDQAILQLHGEHSALRKSIAQFQDHIKERQKARTVLSQKQLNQNQQRHDISNNSVE